MMTYIIGGLAILLTGSWIVFDHFRSKRKLDKEHNGVVKSCKAATTPPVASLLMTTVDVDTMVAQKEAEVESLRQKTGKVDRASKETTRIMKPKPRDPQSDTQLLKVVTDQAEEVKKAAQEKMARKR